MPELCEVALMAQYLFKKLKNKYITDINIIAGKYKRKPMDNINLLQNTKNKVISIDSKGKFMWFELKDEKNDPIYVMFWFGLTGEWSFFTGKNDRIIFNVESKEGKKYNLYFSDQRNFGTIQITKDKNILDTKINSLAPDLLKTSFTVPQFSLWYHNYLDSYPKRHNMTLVDLLMRQDNGDGIVSGIGNYLSAEILYRAKLSPHRKINSLSNHEINELGKTIKYIVKQCYISNKTGYMKTFGNFIDEHKQGVKDGTYPDYHSDIQNPDDFEFLVYKKKFDKLNNPVTPEVIIKSPKRTTYWVPAIQK